MKKNLKALVTVVCLALSLVMSVTYVSAAQIEDPTVEPMWDNTRRIDASLSFLDGIGYADSIVLGDAGTTSIKTDVYVYRGVGSLWFYITEMHVTKNNFISGVSCTFEADENARYRADFIFTVTKDGVDEVITRTSYKTYS